MCYVTQYKTRSGGFLRVLEALRVEGRISDGGVIDAAGAAEAKEMIRLMEAIKFAEHGSGFLKATETAASKPSRDQVALIEDYLFGSKEASDFRRLIVALTGSGGEHVSDGGQPKKDVVDPETVKRYAKEFLDVSDISSRQRQEKVDK